MKFNFYGKTVISTLLFISCQTTAHHPAEVINSEESMGPVFTLPGLPMEQGKLSIGISANYLKIKTFSDSELIAFADKNLTGVHNIDYIFSPSLHVGYGYSEDISGSVSLSYIKRANIKESEIENGNSEAHKHGTAKGISDLKADVRWRILNNDSLSVALNFGLDIPTGQNKDKDIANKRFETEFQPGSGAWNPSIGVAFTKNLYDLGRIDANVSYKFVSDGVQDTNLGNLASYNIAYSKSFIKNISGSLELNGEYNKRGRINGVVDQNSGGNIIYLSPAIKASVSKVTGFLSIGSPISRSLNGTQAKLDYRITLGLSTSF